MTIENYRKYGGFMTTSSPRVARFGCKNPRREAEVGRLLGDSCVGGLTTGLPQTKDHCVRLVLIRMFE